MSSLLDWRYITKLDRAERQGFTCAEPPKYQFSGGRFRHHPRPWEMDVQSFLRRHAPGKGEVMLAGRDGSGLAALSAWDERTPDAVLLQAIAVSSRLRHRGGAWAVELVTETLGRIEARARAVGVEAPLVIARIDRRNDPSEALCREVGMVRLGPVFDSTHLDEWSYSFTE